MNVHDAKIAVDPKPVRIGVNALFEPRVVMLKMQENTDKNFGGKSPRDY